MVGQLGLGRVDRQLVVEGWCSVNLFLFVSLGDQCGRHTRHNGLDQTGVMNECRSSSFAGPVLKWVVGT